VANLRSVGFERDCRVSVLGDYAFHLCSSLL
jgi:hypothetical protein